jgi:hypothetical protein
MTPHDSAAPSRAAGWDVRLICTIASGFFGLAGLVSCGNESQIVAPVPTVSHADGQKLNEAKMARMVAYEEGACAATMVDSAGLQRGFVTPRKILPFEVPKVQKDPVTGAGNGRFTHLRVTPNGGQVVSMTCLVPATLTREAWSRSIKASNLTRWKTILTEIKRARVLPPSPGVQLDREAREFQFLTVGNPPPQVFPSCGYTEIADASCGCYQETWIFGNYAVVIEFQYCDGSNLSGSYEDSAFMSYMTSGGYYQYPCGESSPTEQDMLIAEYSAANKSYIPGCSDFSWFPSTHYYSWAVVQSPGMDDYDIALYSYDIGDAADAVTAAWHANTGQYLTINSWYRTPYHNDHEVPGAAFDSQHIYGDAIDVNSNSSNWQSIRNYFAAWDVFYLCAEPLSISGYGHVHIDYRMYYGFYNPGCPSTWALP